jgi:hypothetical protein
LAKTQLVHLAHARSGDKGNRANVGIIAYDPAHYPLLVEALNPERVKAHFGELVKGEVERFELPNLHALNFVLHDALEGGGTVSLMTDAQAKVTATAFLRMEIDIPASVAKEVRGRGRVPPEVARDLLAGSGPRADKDREEQKPKNAGGVGPWDRKREDS